MSPGVASTSPLPCRSSVVAASANLQFTLVANHWFLMRAASPAWVFAAWRPAGAAAARFTFQPPM